MGEHKQEMSHSQAGFWELLWSVHKLFQIMRVAFDDCLLKTTRGGILGMKEGCFPLETLTEATYLVNYWGVDLKKNGCHIQAMTH